MPSPPDEQRDGAAPVPGRFGGGHTYQGKPPPAPSPPSVPDPAASESLLDRITSHEHFGLAFGILVGVGALAGLALFVWLMIWLFT
jgi:hypothetical protein